MGIALIVTQAGPGRPDATGLFCAIAAVGGFAILGEHITLRVFAAATAILGGIAVVLVGSRRSSDELLAGVAI